MVERQLFDRYVSVPLATKARSVLGLVVLGMFTSTGLLTGCARINEPALTDAQRARNVESFDYVWTTIRDKHWDPELGGLDWDGFKEELRPKVERANNMSQARAPIKDLIKRLELTHFGIVPKDAYGDDEDQGNHADGSARIDIRVIDGQAVVSSVDVDTPASAAGVKPGWIVSRINGKKIEKNLKRVAQHYADSTLKELILSRNVTHRLSGAVGDKIPVEFIDGAGRKVKLDIESIEPRGRRIKFGHMPTMHTWIETDRLAGEVGYIRFNEFFDPAHLMPTLGKAMRSYMDANGVVIDLRGNPGGIGAMAMGIAGWLIKEKDQRLGTMYTRANTLKFVISPRAKVFTGPVAVLVDGLTASTSEIFAGGLQDLDRVRVFGSITAGAALPSVFEKLPNGDGFQYAMANYISAGGEALEGNGVKPDVEVKPTRESLLAGRDVALEAAMDWIKGGGKTASNKAY